MITQHGGGDQPGNVHAVILPVALCDSRLSTTSSTPTHPRPPRCRETAECSPARTHRSALKLANNLGTLLCRLPMPQQPDKDKLVTGRNSVPRPAAAPRWRQALHSQTRVMTRQRIQIIRNVCQLIRQSSCAHSPRLSGALVSSKTAHRVRPRPCRLHETPAARVFPAAALHRTAYQSAAKIVSCHAACGRGCNLI